MKPYVVFLTDVSDLINWIKGSIHCRSSCSVHKHWHKPLDSRDKHNHFTRFHTQWKSESFKTKSFKLNSWNASETNMGLKEPYLFKWNPCHALLLNGPVLSYYVLMYFRYVIHVWSTALCFFNSDIKEMLPFQYSFISSVCLQSKSAWKIIKGVKTEMCSFLFCSSTINSSLQNLCYQSCKFYKNRWKQTNVIMHYCLHDCVWRFAWLWHKFQDWITTLYKNAI